MESESLNVSHFRSNFSSLQKEPSRMVPSLSKQIEDENIQMDISTLECKESLPAGRLSNNSLEKIKERPESENMVVDCNVSVFSIVKESQEDPSEQQDEINPQDGKTLN